MNFFTTPRDIDYRRLDETDLVNLIAKGDDKALEEHNRRYAPLVAALRELSNMPPLDATL